MMYELKKSDSLVVPMKSANKTGLLVAESMEGSGGIARNAELQSTVRTLRRLSRVPSARPHTWAVNSGPASSTRDRSRMREFRTYGSVRGAPSNGRPYRDNRLVAAVRARFARRPFAIAQTRNRLCLRLRVRSFNAADYAQRDARAATALGRCHRVTG